MKTPNWQHNSGKDKKGRGTCKGRLRSRKRISQTVEKPSHDLP